MLKQVTAGALITRKGETTHLAEEGIRPQCIGTGCKDELGVIPELQLFLVRAENNTEMYKVGANLLHLDEYKSGKL